MNKLMKTVVAVAMAAVGFAAVAAPTVKIDKIEDTSVWSTKKVTYTVSGLSYGYENILAFDVTAYSVTTNIKKGAAQNGTFTETLDTAAIFGETRKDPKAKIRVSVEKGEVISGVQLWENGPYFAECNVGATSPEESGYYFWWGDTVGCKRNGSGWDAVDGSKTGFSFSGPNCPTYSRNNTWLKDNGWIDDNGSLVVSDDAEKNHDAARAYFGAPWRMMTDAELQKLTSSYCTRTWVTSYNGKNILGYVVKGKAGTPYENNEVFFPAAGSGVGDDLNMYNGGSGKYLTSTPGSGSQYVHVLSLDKDEFKQGEPYRCYGYSVRPVRDAAQ